MLALVLISLLHSLPLAIASPLLSSTQQPLSTSSRCQPSLHFDDNSFKIMIVSDTHLLDDQTVPGNASNVDRASTQAVRTYLEMENPNYVVHLGDIVSGEAATSTHDVERAVQQILSPIGECLSSASAIQRVRANVPSSTVKGNHDNDKYCTHGSITDIEKAYAGCLSYTQKAPYGIGGGDVGTDNYWVPIYPHKHSTEKPALIMWFFDSRSGKEMLSRGGGPIDDWVDASVAHWIHHETEAMQARWKSVPPSILFVHIPIHAALITQTSSPYRDHIGGVTNETPQNYTPSPLRFPGLNQDLPLSSQEGESDLPYDGQDRAFIDAFMKSAAGYARVHGIVSGHDHGNDWCAPSEIKTAADQIVPLCFAKHSGFGGYDSSRWNHGVRVFHFNLESVDESVQTYIRLLTGERLYDTRLSNDWASF